MVEQEQDQPGLGKDSVPELPGSALGAPVPLRPARPCEEWMTIHSQRLSFASRYSFKYSAGWLSGFQESSSVVWITSFQQVFMSPIHYLNIKVQHAEKERRSFQPSEIIQTVQLTFFLFSLLLKRHWSKKIEQKSEPSEQFQFQTHSNVVFRT